MYAKDTLFGFHSLNFFKGTFMYVMPFLFVCKNTNQSGIFGNFAMLFVLVGIKYLKLHLQ